MNTNRNSAMYSRINHSMLKAVRAIDTICSNIECIGACTRERSFSRISVCLGGVLGFVICIGEIQPAIEVNIHSTQHIVHNQMPIDPKNPFALFNNVTQRLVCVCVCRTRTCHIFLIYT